MELERVILSCKSKKKKKITEKIFITLQNK